MNNGLLTAAGGDPSARNVANDARVQEPGFIQTMDDKVSEQALCLNDIKIVCIQIEEKLNGVPVPGNPERNEGPEKVRSAAALFSKASRNLGMSYEILSYLKSLRDKL